MKKTKNSYKKSGVNIKTANKFARYIGNYSKLAFKKKINKFNKNNIGSFYGYGSPLVTMKKIVDM